MEDRKVAGLVEQSLQRLGFTFIKNQGLNITEFEVRSPCHFIVSVENLTREQFSLLLRSPIRVESAVEIKRLIGSHDPESELKERVGALVGELRRSLPDAPWKRSGILRGGIARRNWESLGEL